MKNDKYNKPINETLKGGDNALDKHQPVQAIPLEVKVWDGGFDQAFRKFKSLVQKERVIASYKEHQRYEKPSQKKRRQRAENQRKRMELQGQFDQGGKKRKKKFNKEKTQEPNTAEKSSAQ